MRRMRPGAARRPVFQGRRQAFFHSGTKRALARYATARNIRKYEAMARRRLGRARWLAEGGPTNGGEAMKALIIGGGRRTCDDARPACRRHRCEVFEQSPSRAGRHEVPHAVKELTEPAFLMRSSVSPSAPTS